MYQSHDLAYKQRISNQSVEYFHFLLAFIIAHEISHALLKHDDRGNYKQLSSEEQNNLARKWEENADRKAIELLSRQSSFEQGLGPSGASLIFINFLIIDGWYGRENATHPADTKRIKSFSSYILNEIDHSFWSETQWNTMRKSAESVGIRALAADVPQYFEVFDRNASNIKLNSSSFYNFK